MSTRLLIILLALLQTPLFGQIVLKRYVQQGIENNLQLKQEQLQYDRSVEGLALARSLFLPQAGLNASYTLADGGRKIDFPIGDLLNPVYATLNQLTGSEKFPMLANQNIQFLPNNFHDTKLRIIQPLFNPDIYFNYKAQKELVSLQQAQKASYENELRFNIESAYFNYLQTKEALSILTNARTTLLQVASLNQKLVANQKATRDVQLNAEYEVNRIDQQLADTKKAHDMAKAYFNFLLNRDLNENILTDSTLVWQQDSNASVADLAAQAVGQRQELKQLQYAVAVNSDLVALSRNTALLPKLNVVGDIGYQGFEYKFNSDQQYWLVQFNLSWDLFKGGAQKARTQQAKIDYQVAENKMAQLKRQIELQVVQSYRELEAAQQAYETSKSGVVSAEKSFQIIRARYQEGQALMLELTDAQNKAITARLTETIKLYEVLRAQAGLRKTLASI